MKHVVTNMAVMAFMMCVFVSSAYTEDVVTKTDGMIYYVPISYSDSLYKDDALTRGVYVYYGYGEDKAYEAGLDFTNITYKPDVDYDQRDFTFVYSGFKTGSKTRYGFHHISSSTDTNDGYTLFAGRTNYKGKLQTTNVNTYVSFYKNLPSSLRVIQISPSVGRDYPKKDGAGFYSLTSANYIRLNEDIGTEGNDFISVEQSVTYYKDTMSVTAHGWVGSEMFAVRNDGFAVSNKPEKQTGAYGLSVKYTMPEKYSVTLGVDKETFKDEYSENKADARKYSLMISHAF